MSVAGLSRTDIRYKAKPSNDDALRHRLKELAAKHASYGHLFLHHLLRAEDLVKNIKRTCRIYTSEVLQVRSKKRKKLKTSENSNGCSK